MVIVRLWMLKHEIETITPDVKSALDELVKVGLVVRQERVGHAATYELNKKELTRVRTLLRDKKAGPE